MKAKALRYKKEFDHFQEFVHIIEYGGEPMVFTSGTPILQPETATIEDMQKLIETNDYYEGLKINFDKLELVELDIIESGVVGADIRNKLTPPNNLVAMLETYFSVRIAHVNDERHKLAELIQKEMKNTKKSIDYIKNLF